jgi:hypothetical protein
MKSMMLLAPLVLMSISSAALALTEGASRAAVISRGRAGTASFFYARRHDGPTGVCSYSMLRESPFPGARPAPCIVRALKNARSDSCFAIFDGSSLDSSGDGVLIPGAAPSAMNSSAWPRKTMRRSAFSGRLAISMSARCAEVSASGTVGRQQCGRFAHGAESIMSQPVAGYVPQSIRTDPTLRSATDPTISQPISGARKPGQISGERN